MNTFSKNTKALFALLLSCCLFVAGCKDDEQPVTEPDAEITAISPTSGPIGTQVTITGANFGNATDVQRVDFNGTEAVVTSVTDNQIVVTVPEGATSGNLNVQVRDKTVVGPVFTVEEDTEEPEEPAEITITEINPVSGPVGTSVTITGTGFGDEITDQIVAFNGAEAEIEELSNESITVLVPMDATTGVVSFTSGETTVEGPSFEVTPEEEEPGITSIAPTAGPVGTEVSIRGYGFGEDMEALTVDFNGTDAEITSATNEEVMVVVPAGATTGPVNLTVDGTTYTSAEDFTVTEEEGGIYYGEGFTLDAPLEINGQSGLKEGLGINGETILRLTPAKSDRTGTAYYGTTVPVEGGFETVFDFRISRPGKPEGVETERGADGFAFIIQNEGPNAYGGRGPDKGYGGIMNAVVVDFDIFKNEEDGDPNGNHVSIQVSKGGGAVHADENYRLALASSDTFPDMPVDFITNEYGSHTARVVYTPGTADTKGLLQVWIDDMAEPLMAELDLEDYLNSDDGTAYVGFTASTSPTYGWASFDILNWMFQPTTAGGGEGE